MTIGTSGEMWSRQARQWAQYQEPLFRCFYEPVLSRAGVEEGTRLLDVGCGAGLGAQIAAQRGAQVAGIDASAGSVEIARERTPNGDFRVGDMQTLPWEDGSFDVVTGFNSFQLAGSPVDAFAEGRRILKPGGRLAVLIWGREEENDQAAIVAAMNTLVPRAPEEAHLFTLSPPGVLESSLEQAGFTVVSSGTIPCPFDYVDLETAYRALSSSGRVAAIIDQVGEEQTRSTLSEALTPFRTESGGYRLNNVFRFVIAT